MLWKDVRLTGEAYILIGYATAQLARPYGRRQDS